VRYTSPETTRARVFLSCGQQKDTSEVTIAHRVSTKLEKMGFEPYIAVEEQTLKGVKENIFTTLKNSEYLIFIDFKREELVELTGKSETKKTVYRGGLFSNQELAIAAFLETKVLAFQEDGIKKLDGILQFIQANCFPFKDRNTLPEIIEEQVKQKHWNPNWRKELTIERDDDEEYEDAIFKPDKQLSRWYHIKVKNLHEREMALSCLAYLLSVKKISGRKVKVHDRVEFKWKGVKSTSVSIPPNEYRNLDALRVSHVSPSVVHLTINQFLVDFSGYLKHYVLEGPNKYELDFVVFSTNFSPSTATFTLHIGETLREINFYKKRA
jgi:hypothetical protein